jgi:hypothetical protein
MRLCSWCLAVVLLACGGRREARQDEEPPSPECTRASPDADPEGPTCAAGWTVECDSEKPYPICVYDAGETTGTARCTGQVGDLNFLPPYYYPDCVDE